MTPAAPGRVLRLALLAWGMGHLALGRRTAGSALLAAELVSLAAVVALTARLVDTSWYLVPFLAGCGFLVAWAWQAVHAYRAAQLTHGATAPTPVRSPAAAIGWLALPLLAWGVGFWLVAATAATPAAIVDRFVAGWTGSVASDDAWAEQLSNDPAALRAAAATATARLERLCRQGILSSACAAGGSELYRDVRFRVEAGEPGEAVAVGEAVRYESRPSSFLGIFEGREVVPVPFETIIALRLETEPAFLDAVRWRIVGAEAG